MCAPCGVAPVVSFDVALAAGDNELVVTAPDDHGHTSSAKDEVTRESALPPDYGNVLHVLAAADDGVRLVWGAPPPARTTLVEQRAARDVSAPEALMTVPQPGEEWLVEAPARPLPLTLYRVRGRNGAGEAGP